MADPATLSGAQALLRAQGLRPRKRWGQNFLCDRNTLERITREARLAPHDPVLEIGPGLGALTRSLALAGAMVTAVEIDTLLAPILHETLAGFENVTLIFADFLRLDPAELLDTAFGDTAGSVVASIPYYITTPILERLFANKHHIKRIVLLVQQEFADRVAAKPDTEDYGAMSVFAQFHARVEYAGRVSRHVFLPVPEVDSAIVTLTPVSGGTVPVRDEGAFFGIVRAAFGKRRKTLLNALVGGDIGLSRDDAGALLESAGIAPTRRGETLSLAEFAKLADAWSEARAAR